MILRALSLAATLLGAAPAWAGGLRVYLRVPDNPIERPIAPPDHSPGH